MLAILRALVDLAPFADPHVVTVGWVVILVMVLIHFGHPVQGRPTNALT